MKVIYTGSFDPVTYGHIDIIKRARDLFGEVIVTILHNPAKQGLFTVEERIELLEEVFKDEENIYFDSYTGLGVDYAKEKNCKVFVRGIRSVSDYEMENPLATANKEYKYSVETVFLLSSKEYLFVSSSLAKEVAKYGGDLSLFVPDVVGIAMKEKYNRR